MDVLKCGPMKASTEITVAERDETALITSWLRSVVTANTQQIQQIRPLLEEVGATQPGDLLRLYQEKDEDGKYKKRIQERDKVVLRQLEEIITPVKRWKLSNKVLDATCAVNVSEHLNSDDTTLLVNWLKNIPGLDDDEILAMMPGICQVCVPIFLC